MGSTISILSIVRVTSMKPKFRKNAWMGGYLGSSKSTRRELMETEMKLENEFRSTLCLRVKIFKAFWATLMSNSCWSSWVKFYFPLLSFSFWCACSRRCLSCEQFVSSSRGCGRLVSSSITWGGVCSTWCWLWEVVESGEGGKLQWHKQLNYMGIVTVR